MGHIICAADKSIYENQHALVSVLCWTSHKNDRAAPSTLLNESTSYSATLANGEWVASWRIERGEVVVEVEGMVLGVGDMHGASYNYKKVPKVEAVRGREGVAHTHALAAAS